MRKIAKQKPGVIVLTQGDYGRALTASAADILGAGGIDGVRAISAGGGDSPAAIERKLRAALGDGGDALILCDIFGATPANVARKIAAERGGVVCAFGVNLPMLLEALTFRAAGGGAQALALRAAAAARRAVCVPGDKKKDGNDGD